MNISTLISRLIVEIAAHKAGASIQPAVITAQHLQQAWDTSVYLRTADVRATGKELRPKTVILHTPGLSDHQLDAVTYPVSPAPVQLSSAYTTAQAFWNSSTLDAVEQVLQRSLYVWGLLQSLGKSKYDLPEPTFDMIAYHTMNQFQYFDFGSESDIAYGSLFFRILEQIRRFSSIMIWGDRMYAHVDMRTFRSLPHIMPNLVLDLISIDDELTTDLHAVAAPDNIAKLPDLCNVACSTEVTRICNQLRELHYCFNAQPNRAAIIVVLALISGAMREKVKILIEDRQYEPVTDADEFMVLVRLYELLELVDHIGGCAVRLYCTDVQIPENVLASLDDTALAVFEETSPQNKEQFVTGMKGLITSLLDSNAKQDGSKLKYTIALSRMLCKILVRDLLTVDYMES